MTTPSPTALTLADAGPASLVAIGGAEYRLFYAEDLTLAKSLRYTKLMAVARPLFNTAWKGGELTDEQDATLTGIVRQLAALATDAPATVLDALRESQRLQLVATAFFDLPPVVAPAPEAAPVPKTSRTKRSSRR
jgi:hypothetical protein